MDGYTALNAEITSIRSFALLNLLELDCADLNKEMSNRCLSLRNSLILWQVSAQKACLGLGGGKGQRWPSRFSPSSPGFDSQHSVYLIFIKQHGLARRHWIEPNQCSANPVATMSHAGVTQKQIKVHDTKRPDGVSSFNCFKESQKKIHGTSGL